MNKPNSSFAQSLSKIRQPRVENVYLREDFFTVLDGCMDGPAVWLSAPPGAGKTTLISSFAQARGLDLIWYQADAGDSDPATFFHFLTLASENFNSDIESPLPTLAPEYMLGLSAFSREYFSELYKRFKKRSVIVFDNYQEVAIESPLHEIIHAGLQVIPKDITVIFLSRTGPPPVLSRLRLKKDMELITYDDLRLTADEVKGILSQKEGQGVTDDLARSMLAKTDGWVGGLVLILEEGCSGEPSDKSMIDGAVSGEDYPAVFDYFANEFFHKEDDAVRDLLMRSSVLPSMTIDMVTELTGSDLALQVISGLSRRNYFIQNYAGAEGAATSSYQYHPLFREFLYSRLRETLSEDELFEIERKAAMLLLSNRQVEAAVGLLQKAAAWERLSLLICEEGRTMLAQGRHQTLLAWLGVMPEQVVYENPWLLFWRASCFLPFDQLSSRLSFEKAFDSFRENKEAGGIFLSWSGIVDSITFTFDDLKPLDKWIGVFYDLLEEYPDFLNPQKGSEGDREIAGRLTFTIFMALFYRAPQHEDIEKWAEGACAVFNAIEDPNVFSQAGLFLVDYYIWTGEMEKANLIVERLLNNANKDDKHHLALICTKLSEALINWYLGDLKVAIRALTEGLEIAGKSGVYIFNYFLYGHGAIGSITAGDIEGAALYLEKAASVLDERKRLCASYYYHIVACYRLLKGELSASIENEELALSLAVDVGMSFGEAMSLSGMALLQFERNEVEKARETLAETRALAISINSKLVEYVTYIFEAYFDLEKGDRVGAIKNIKKAMELGARHGIVNFHMWRPDIMSRLCMLALEEGVETAYVQRLILKRDLFPQKSPLDIEEWPWRLRIYFMGPFTVIKDNEPLKFGKKVPKKPIEMLKLLISLGGEEVLESTISDTLWPDGEGDAAHIAFTTTLKRLRQLLGIDDALILRSGRLSINPRYVWVDLWAFNSILEEVGRLGQVRAGDEIDPDEPARLLQRAIDIYGEGFNIRFEEEPWAILFRERVRSKFVRSVVRLASHWELKGDTERAVDSYIKAIEVDSLSEELYRKLMRCFIKSGRKAEAKALYRQLTELFKDILGIEPSSETREIYKDLK